jgi:thiamine-phosphate pyrophosphorylase
VARALPALYAIVDPLDTGQAPLVLARAFLDGGVRLLQLRLKAASPRELHAEAAAIRPLARTAGALFIVNDRPDVARAVDADGVHLGQSDVPVRVARAVLGANAMIGVSTHSIEQARDAERDGADYVAIGPVFPTTSKAHAEAAGGLDLVRATRAAVRCPLVAIGGITPATAQAVRTACADAVAMIAALVRASDPRSAARALIEALAAR